MKRKPLRLAGCMAISIHAALLASLSAAVTWDNSNGTNTWSIPNNWDTNVEPVAADDVIFPAGLAATITLSAGENAKSLQFDDNYTLTAGGLTLAAASTVTVAPGVTATTNTPITTTGGLSKNGLGRFTIGSASTGITGGVTVNAGALRLGNTNPFAASTTATVMNSAALEVGAVTVDRPISLRDGSSLLGAAATAVSNGTATIDAAATSITLGTLAAADLLTLGNAANDLTGGTAATTISLSGPGSVRLAQNSNFDGAWNLPAGTRLDLVTATAAGDTPASGITLAGGTLAGRGGAALNFTGSQANTLTVTADSTLLSDRSSATAGLAYTFGTLAMGAQTLTVAPGANATSGTGEIVLGNVTFSGNPTLAVNDSGATNGKLTTGSLLGGGLARTVTKTGAGDLTINGGATDLPAGSQFTATGGGVIELRFPALGAGASITPTTAQNPLGESTISVTDGSLRLLANGDGTTAAQTFLLNNPVTLGGTIILDPDRQTAGTTKTFELTGLTLAADTALTIAGDNTYGTRLSGPLTLQGSASIQGSAVTSKDGLLTLNGGISGGAAGDTLTLLGGTSPLNLTLNASASRPGSTVVNGATVTANAAAAFGSGATTVSGGTLTVNTDAALTGTATLTGGTLRVNDVDALAANPIALNGGTLDLRNNTSTTFTTGTLTLGGNATVNVANNGSGSTQTITLPPVNVSGNRTLTLTNGNSFIPLLSSVALAGDLTLSHTLTARSGAISEDASPRKLLKAGTGQLELEALSTYSGGTEILAGTLLVENPDALGSGAVTLGDTAGTSTATLRLAAGLTLANDVTVRSGSSGVLTIGAVSPANSVLDGDVTLQRTVAFDNSGASPLTISGRITGGFDISRTGSGEVILTNPLNDFGTGGAAALNITSGTVSAGSDAPLGTGGITISASGTFKATGTFSTLRSITVTAGGNIEVDPTHVLTLNTALAGDTSFDKTGEGTLAFGPGVVSTRTAGMNLTNGTLRLTGATGLGTASPIAMSTSAILDLRNDTSTNYGHPVTVNAGGSVNVNVDRAEGGIATGGTHTLGTIALGTGSLTTTGANGFGLTLGAVTTTGSATLTNNAPGTLTLPSLNLGGTAGARTMTLDSTGGDIFINGSVSQTGLGTFALTKRGTHTLHLTSGLNIGGALNVQNGTLDLEDNNVTLSSTVSLAGLSSVVPSVIQTGTGTLTLGGDVSYSSGNSPPGAQILGLLNLGAANRRFTINDSIGATVDLEINAPVSGTTGWTKAGTGTLRLNGATANTFQGLLTVEQGRLELNKSGVHAVGTGGITVAATSASATAILLAPDQWPDTTALGVNAVSNLARLDLNNFTETVASVSMASTSSAGGVLATGATGTLVVNGPITLANNRNNFGNDARELLITGTGTNFTPATDGTLDLGGATRTIAVTTTVVGASEPLCNATIETRITNGGILKTGARTLFLTNPNNDFAGGITIAGGCVELGSPGAQGTGGITLANTGTDSACINLGTATGLFSPPITIAGGGGTGVAKLTYDGNFGDTLTLGGALDLSAQALCVEVTNGTTDLDDGAVLAITGVISDGASSFGLTKTGDGILELSPGNSYTGLTIQRGAVRVSSATALGDVAGVLALDGGCLHATEAIVFAHDLHFLTGGGSLHVNRPSDVLLPRHVLTIPSLTWGGATSAFFGSGQVILSGTTVSSAAALQIGTPTSFAQTSFSAFHGLGMVFSLRGTATLPTGNLSMTNNAVLELGNGDFTRAVGIAAGEVQLPTQYGAGWAAHGADRVVNLGGAGATLVWGSNSASAPFLNTAGGSLNSAGDLILGSEYATHTVDFQNNLEMETGGSSFFSFREIVVPDGPAAKEAVISGDISFTTADQDPLGVLDLAVEGMLEISGNISGPVGVTIYEPGTAILSGTNTFTRDLEAGNGGTLVIASDASAGSPESMWIEDLSHINAGGMTSPLTLSSPNANAEIFGTFTGSLIVNGYVGGDGLITGSLTANAGINGNEGIEAYGAEPLRIGGNFSLGAANPLYAWIGGTVPVADYAQISVTGTVTLAGVLDLYSFYPVSPMPGDAYHLILNAGNDAISGIFDGLPEGAALVTGDGTELMVTYMANGDGGPVDNDFALIVTSVPPPTSDEIPILSITRNPATGQITMSIPTDNGQDYEFEISTDLENWSVVESFTGDGTPYEVTSPLPVDPRSFLRIRKGGGVAVSP